MRSLCKLVKYVQTRTQFLQAYAFKTQATTRSLSAATQRLEVDPLAWFYQLKCAINYGIMRRAPPMNRRRADGAAASRAHV